MPRAYPYAQVDVFSEDAFGGNPVAVILDSGDLSAEQMQRIARWTNLSETTFLLPSSDPAADYRARIFTPHSELPFAGHPTLGSARAWLHYGGQPQVPGEVTQECTAGLIRVRAEQSTLSFAAPPTLRSGPLEEELLVRIAAAFSIERAQILDHQWVDNGPGWAVVQLASASDVLALEPHMEALGGTKVGTIGAYPTGSGASFEIRAFTPHGPAFEDPVTGSLNAGVAQWMVRTGRAPASYCVTQGQRLGRTGKIEIRSEDGIIWVGGRTAIGFEGVARL
ncbi:PhzF family phenazine biosynthesis protein [Glutamicibacter endophyticus]